MEMETVFGFPSWWGRNTDAMYDCLSTLRGPIGDEMTSFVLSFDDYIILEVNNTSFARFNVNESLYEVIAGINQFFYDTVSCPITIMLLLKNGLKDN